MPCVCASSLDALAAQMAGVGTLAPGMSAKAAASLGASASATAGATAGASAAAAAGASGALGAALGLAVDVALLGKLSAMASACGGAKAMLGIDLTSPGAQGSIDELGASMESSAFADKIQQLPLGAAPDLAAIAALANVAALGVNPLSAGASAQLNAMASAAASVNGSASAAGSSAASGAASGAAAADAEMTAQMAAQMAAMAGAQAACTAGLGIDLAGGGAGGVGSLASLLGTVASNLASLASVLGVLPLGALTEAASLFQSLSMANALLGTNLAVPGANVGASLSATASANASADALAQAAAIASAGALGGPPLAGAARAQQSVFQSAEFGDACSGLGAPPSIVGLLLSMLSGVMTSTGTQIVQTTPCATCFLVSSLPEGCLCPGLVGVPPPPAAAVPAPDAAVDTSASVGVEPPAPAGAPAVAPPPVPAAEDVELSPTRSPDVPAAGKPKKIWQRGAGDSG